jgi:nitroreductase
MVTPDWLLTTTRSVRRRLDLDRPVPMALVEDCLRIARQAPCGSGRNIGHWIVITDPAIRAEIGEVYRSAFERNAGSLRSTPSLDSARYLAHRLGEVPVLVLACLETGGPLPGGSQASLWGSLLPSVWSYMLAARVRGLGTVLTTAHLAGERQVAELLGIPPEVHQGALIPTAYYLGDTFRPAARSPLEGVLHRERW